MRLEDENLLVNLKMVKLGYASSLNEAKAMSIREVKQALHFETFRSDYERAYHEVNRADAT